MNRVNYFFTFAALKRIEHSTRFHPTRRTNINLTSNINTSTYTGYPIGSQTKMAFKSEGEHEKNGKIDLFRRLETTIENQESS